MIRLGVVVSVISTILALPHCAAQLLNVKIIDRRDGGTTYTYVVPAHSKTNSQGNIDCVDTELTTNCSVETRVTGSQTPSHVVSYEVRGATLSLQLPDGRITVVNCESKARIFATKSQPSHRSCRVPIVDDIQVEFKGSKAKLQWPVSVDGTKMQSETYQILGILDDHRSKDAQLSQ